jgi:5-dehydro-2-deoxygluconokinase
MNASFDVITMGRTGVDIYPLQTGVPLERVESFGKFLGGSATNVAVASARLGRSTAVITRTGQDPFGRYVHEALEGFGVDDRWVSPVADCSTPVTFCEIFPPDDFPLYFYRRPKAPDLEIRTEELGLDAIRSSLVLWITATGPRTSPGCASTRASCCCASTTGTPDRSPRWSPPHRLPMRWPSADCRCSSSRSSPGGSTGASGTT